MGSLPMRAGRPAAIFLILSHTHPPVGIVALPAPDHSPHSWGVESTTLRTAYSVESPSGPASSLLGVAHQVRGTRREAHLSASLLCVNPLSDSTVPAG